MTKEEYAEYLLSDEWNARRAEHIRIANRRCQICNESDQSTTLHVHHRTYERLGRENFTDLIVLCGDCHKLFHQAGKIKHFDNPAQDKEERVFENSLVHRNNRDLLERIFLRLAIEDMESAIHLSKDADFDERYFLCIEDEDYEGDINNWVLFCILRQAVDEGTGIKSAQFQKYIEKNRMEGLFAELALINIPPGNSKILMKDTIHRIKELSIRYKLETCRAHFKMLLPNSQEAVAAADEYHKLKQELVNL